MMSICRHHISHLLGLVTLSMFQPETQANISDNYYEKDTTNLPQTYAQFIILNTLFMCNYNKFTTSQTTKWEETYFATDSNH